MKGSVPPPSEDDPELEQELREWAQWLLDVYLWKLQQERHADGTPEVDIGPPSHTM
jgi:hypothetical protein